MENTYLVMSHEEGDILKIQEELLAESGDSHIPSRVCSSPDLILESDTITLFCLTKEEAEKLSNDPRIKHVSLCEEEESMDLGKNISRGPINLDGGHAFEARRTFTSPQELNAAAPTSYEDFMTKADTLAGNLYLHGVKDKHLFEPVISNGLTQSAYDPEVKVPKYNSDGLRFLDIKDYHMQADGEGVDIVIFDRTFGYEYNPQFEGKNGYRFKMVNWWKEAGYPDDDYWVQQYSDKSFYGMGLNGHGLRCAEAAAGLEGGFAKGAHIYNARSGYTLRDENNAYVHHNRVLLLVLEWHKRKFQEGGSRRPTVLASSVSSFSKQTSGMPTRGRYRGTEWTYNNETRQELTYKYGLRFADNVSMGGALSRDFGGILDTTSLYMRMLHDAGVPVCLAAGNAGQEADHPTNNDWIPQGLEHVYANDNNPNLDFYEGNIGLDWDNYVVFDDVTYNNEPAECYYNRANTPWFNGAIYVGELDISKEDVTGTSISQSNAGENEHVMERTAKGAGVACYAHTYNIVTDGQRTFNYDATNRVSGLKGMDITNWDHFYRPSRLNPNYRNREFTGSSAAAPTTAGLIALYLEKEPELTPTEVHRKLQESSKRFPKTKRIDISDNPIRSYYQYNYLNTPTGGDKFAVPHNPYWERDNVEISGNVNLHSSTYLTNSDLSAGSQVINPTDITNYLAQSTLTAENNNMTTENNTTTVSLQVKDENNVNVTTDELVIDFVASDGSLGDVVSEGSGLYTATYFAPPTGSGNIELKAKIYGQEVQETLSLFYQGTDLQLPPSINTTIPEGLTSAVVGDTTTVSLVENSGAGQVFASFVITTNYGPCTVTAASGSTDKLSIVKLSDTSYNLVLTDNPDYESYQSLQCDVIVTDQLGQTTTQKIDVLVIDADDVGPVFSNGVNPTALSFNEHTKVNEVVYSASATDDSGGGVIYSLPVRGQSVSLVKQSDFFTIGQTTGDLTLVQDISYETHTALQAVITATDAAGNVSNQTVTIPVNNVDEIAPVFSSGTTGLVIFEGETNKLVYDADAFDTGDGTDSSITYSLDTTYEQSNRFAILPDAGQVVLLNAVTAAEFTEMKFKVIATDSAGNSSERVITSAVTLAADTQAPVIISSNTAPAIVEGSGTGQTVYIASATDNRSAPIFTLSSNSDADVSITANGVVTLNVNPNYAVKTRHIFTVIATDAAGNSSSKTVTLSIINTDTAAPVFSEASYSATIQEGTLSDNAVLFTVEAVDLNEATDGVITYGFNIENYNGAQIFSLAQSGQFILKAGFLADYADHNDLNITITATDASGNTSSVPVYITVEESSGYSTVYAISSNTAYNAGENTTATQSGNDWDADFTYTEDSFGEILVGVVANGAAEDAEFEIISTDFNDEQLTLEISEYSGFKIAHIINNNINAAVDNEHNITIRYTQGDFQPIDIRVKITIANGDNTAPVIATDVEPVNLNQNGDFDTGVLYQASSDDPLAKFTFVGATGFTTTPDGVLLRRLRLSYAGFTPELELNEDTGEVTWSDVSGNSMADCPESVTYTIKCTDPFNNSTTLEVTHDVTEAVGSGYEGELEGEIVGSTTHPFLGYPLYSIAEQTPAGTELFTVRALRADNGDILDNSLNNVVYSMPLNDDFEIDATTGVVSAKRDFYDFETDDTVLRLSFLSIATPYNSKSVTFMHENQNVNEGQTWTIADNTTMTVSPPSAGTVIIPNIYQYVSDDDGDGLVFTIDTLVNGVIGQPVWSLDQSTGNIRSTNAISASSSVYTHQLRVNATDADGVSSSRTISFIFDNLPLMEKVVYPADQSGSGGLYVGYVASVYGNKLGSIYAAGGSPPDTEDTSSTLESGIIDGLYFLQYSNKAFYYKNTSRYAGGMDTSWTSIEYSLNGTTAQDRTFLRSDSNYSSYVGFYWGFPNSGPDYDWFQFQISNSTGGNDLPITLKWY